ncbi:MAG: thiol peroxidase [Planctomycetes bacterium]|nr:thiol peroxidase [Planctomycetota bacterium]
MARITLKGNPIHTSGDLPKAGGKARDFTLVRQDLSEANLRTYSGKKKVLNVYPSVDTGVCAASVRAFHERANALPGVVVLNISCDLPFAAGRFCAAEGIANAETLSAFRSSFPDDYGLRITDGPLRGLCSRAVIVLDAGDKVLYAEQVPEIAQEPDYDGALAAL